MTPDAEGRQAWQVSAPSGGVQPPWPQLIEIVQAIPHTPMTSMVSAWRSPRPNRCIGPLPIGSRSA